MIQIANHFLHGRATQRSGGRDSDRFMLWIDAVGGYWVCLGNEVALGQPNRRRAADVPILGDLSGRHALLRRDGERYLIKALDKVDVDGCPVSDFGWLPDQSRIELGGSVRLLFRQPHPLSGTARLDFLSRHRTHPSADAVLLMAGSCILGPKPNCHVVCPDWAREVILYRHEEELYCRAAGPFEVDGVTCKDRGRINRTSRIQGEGFSLNLEAIG
jgi:hypothetical protein